jgi:hypothetical protein
MAGKGGKPAGKAFCTLVQQVWGKKLRWNSQWGIENVRTASGNRDRIKIRKFAWFARMGGAKRNPSFSWYWIYVLMGCALLHPSCSSAS